MRKSSVKIAIFMLIVFFIVGCMVKKTMKKAGEYESAGMFKDASELYYKACICLLYTSDAADE